jgi:phage shock protein E
MPGGHGESTARDEIGSSDRSTTNAIPPMNAFIILAAALLVIGCAGPKQDSSAGAAAGSAASSQPSASKPVYVDVRTAEEYASGHVAGAIHIPYDEMPARWQELESYRDSSLVLYCRSGRRSGIAIDVLEEKGFKKLENGGGIDDLRSQGVAVE